MVLDDYNATSQVIAGHLRTVDSMFQGSESDSFHGAHPFLHLIYILYFGSTQSNKSQMEHVFPGIETAIPYYSEKYSLHELINASDSSKVGFCSGIAILDSIKVKQEYTSLVRDVFGTRTFNLSCLSNREKVCELNAYIEEATDGMIRNFFTESDIKYTSVIVFNALFFSLKWRVPFDPDLTQKDYPFLTYCGGSDIPHSYDSPNTVDMMMNPGTYVNVKEVKGIFTMFELEFEDQEITVTFLKPHMSIEWFEDHNNVPDEVKKFADGEGVLMKKADVGVPKFVINHKEKLGEKAKKILGLDKMFRPGNTEERRFGNITDEDLFVSEIMQAGTIEVNETGVKVAVVTAATMNTMSLETPVSLILDSEFLIIFHFNGDILLKGYFYNQEGQNSSVKS